MEQAAALCESSPIYCKRKHCACVIRRHRLRNLFRLSPISYRKRYRSLNAAPIHGRPKAVEVTDSMDRRTALATWLRNKGLFRGGKGDLRIPEHVTYKLYLEFIEAFPRFADWRPIRFAGE